MAIKMTREEYLKTYGHAPVLGGSQASQPTDPSFGQEAGQDIKQIGTDIASSFNNRQAEVQAAKKAYESGKQGILQTGFQTLGNAAGFVSDAIGAGVKGVVKSVLPQSAENAIKTTLSSVASPVVNSDTAKSFLDKYHSLDENTKRNLDATLGLGSLALDLATGFGGKKVAQTGVEIAAKGAVKAGLRVGETVLPAVETLNNVMTGVKNVTSPIIEGVGRLPSRIATNVADKQATRQLLNQLPTEIAKNAAKDGVDLNDVKYLYSIPKEQKKQLIPLLQAAKKFESGVSKTNPIEIVGKPIVQRIKQLEAARGVVGLKLGQVADTLGKVSTKEVYPEVFNQLKRVQGLNGLKVSGKGVLDFSDTVLATAETSGDRRAIQSIFISAIKNGTGKQKHLLRQELFESLGGKKASLINLTDTQAKAYEAIRKGLSNVIDTKNTEYKRLNKEYATISQPLADMRKFMKTTGATEDIVNMQAGLLARRLTSNASSNPQIRGILQSMDRATKVKGVAQTSVETLQDFYNLLDRYYNIAGKTGFQGQVTSGVEKVSNVRNALSKFVGDLAGQTTAVQRKALENALSEALKVSPK